MNIEVDRKSGQKTFKVDRKSGQKKCDSIISLISGNPKISSTLMAESLGMSRSSISKYLKQLQEDNVIKRIGPDKGGYWKVL